MLEVCISHAGGAYQSCWRCVLVMLEVRISHAGGAYQSCWRWVSVMMNMHVSVMLEVMYASVSLRVMGVRVQRGCGAHGPPGFSEGVGPMDHQGSAREGSVWVQRGDRGEGDMAGPGMPPPPLLACVSHSRSHPPGCSCVSLMQTGRQRACSWCWGTHGTHRGGSALWRGGASGFS